MAPRGVSLTKHGPSTFTKVDAFMRDGDVESSTHYTTLEVHSSATRDEIRQSFRRLILLHHPDRLRSGQINLPENDRAGHGEVPFDVRAEALNTAYGVLYDPEKRSAYDEQLRLAKGAGNAILAKPVQTLLPSSDLVLILNMRML